MHRWTKNVQCELTALDTPFLMFARKEESAQKPSCDRTQISQKFFMSDAEQIIKKNDLRVLYECIFLTTFFKGCLPPAILK